MEKTIARILESKEEIDKVRRCPDDEDCGSRDYMEKIVGSMKSLRYQHCHGDYESCPFYKDKERHKQKD